MGGTTLKTLGVFVALVAGAAYLDYGTLSPCGALRETVRKQDGLARILPDSVVDAVIEAHSGPLSPGRCLALLIGGQHAPAPTVAAAPPAAAAQAPQANSAQANLQAASNEMATAINECRAKRISGEFESFVQSAQCSNPRIMQAFRKANYRYMDLIALMVAKRTQISERLDHKEISEADAGVALQQAFTDVVTAERARDAMRK
jgi:hypothetical protein